MESSAATLIQRSTENPYTLAELEEFQNPPAPSSTDEYGTPLDLFEHLDREFRFKLDAAASHSNTCLPNYITAEQNALTTSWYKRSGGGVVWVNPPYSKPLIGYFVRKMVAESGGVVVVALIRHDPSTDWFQRWVYSYAAEIRMLKYRVKHRGGDGLYNFPQCIAVFRPDSIGSTPTIFYDSWAPPKKPRSRLILPAGGNE